MDRARVLLSIAVIVEGVVLLAAAGTPSAGPAAGAAGEGGGTPKDGTNSFAVALSDMMPTENVQGRGGRE